MGTKITI